MPRAFALSVWLLGMASAGQETPRSPLHRTVDLSLGESATVQLADGKSVTVKLLDLKETREDLCTAIWRAEVKVAVGGTEIRLTAGTYQLPVTVGDVQIDCPVTGGPRANSEQDYWALEKDARLRIWPATSALIEPGTYVYPLKQRWFAADAWISNEPVLVGIPPKNFVYYHSGLDLGGSEGQIEVVSATDGLVVVAGKEGPPDDLRDALIPGYPTKRYTDQVHIVDDRGWVHAYVHLKTIEVRAGDRIRMGARIGLLGKEGGSGGWSHLHYEIRRRQPSGRWGTENGFAFLWESYRRRFEPPVLAMAGPLHHRLTPTGSPVTLDARLSRSFAGEIARTEWAFSDGTSSSAAEVTKTYDRPGTYSESLKVVDTRGNVDYDFVVVEAVDPRAPKELPPRLHAAYAPTFGVQPGDPVTFKVRTWNTKDGEETWDFGDGTPAATTKSANAYAEIRHRYEKPGHYLVRVERAAAGGARGTTHLQVRVGETAAVGKSWQGWLDRKSLPPEEAKGMMDAFVERQLTPLPLPETREAWLSRRDALRREILDVLGIDDVLASRGDPVVTHKGTLQREGYRIEKITYESWPGFAVPAVIYIPDGLKDRAPGIVSITGHTDISKAADYIQQRNVNLALRGCVVLDYDYWGYGERKTGNNRYHPEGANGHSDRRFSFGRRTATGLEVLDAVRAVDALLARKEVDPERIGFTGESGGSNSTYWIAAVDPRVKLVVPVSSVTTYDYWIRTQKNWDWHQRPPGIRRIADIGTLLALHAPNPLVIISSKRGTDDQEFPLEEAEKSHQWARHVYKLLGAEESVGHYESTTSHGYQEDKRAELYRWVEKWLKPPFPKGDVELKAKVETQEDLRCGLPESNLTVRDVYTEWLKPLPRAAAPAELREFLLRRLGLPDPLPAAKGERRGSEQRDGLTAEFWTFESEPGIRLSGVLIARDGADGPITLLPGRNAEAAARALAAGRRVFAFDPRGTRETAEGGYRGNTWGDRPSNWAWFAGRPWPGLWALDLLQAARLCRDRFAASVVSVDAPNMFGWPSLLAGAARPDLLSSGAVRIPAASLLDVVRERGENALADVPGLLERMDVAQLRTLWPDAQVTVGR